MDVSSATTGRYEMSMAGMTLQDPTDHEAMAGHDSCSFISRGDAPWKHEMNRAEAA
jgi:hypothetical protein